MKRVSEDTYKRRLAKAITKAAWLRGAYYKGGKVMWARYSKGNVILVGCVGEMIMPDEAGLEDGYGRPICVSHFE